MHADWLLAADMDGTILPLDDTPAGEAAIAAFGAACARRRDIALAYLTGRHLDLALDGIRRYRLPLPAALGCDVGTSLYWRDGDSWCQDEAYRSHMRAQLDGTRLTRVTRILDALPGFHRQEDHLQAEFKCSYYTRVQQATPEAASALREQLQAAGIALQVVVSVDPLRDRGLVDVLPSGVDKATVLAYLQEELEVAADRSFFAGDSGNDSAALLSGCLAVVVGNAPAELKRSLHEQAAARGGLERIYFATGDCTAGVLEGAQYHGLLDNPSQTSP